MRVIRSLNVVSRGSFDCCTSAYKLIIKLNVIQNALQAACGYTSALTAYIHKLYLELFVITGNDVT